MRRQHVIKLNRNVELPQYLTFVDTESRVVSQDADGELHHLRFGVAEMWRHRRDSKTHWTRLDAFRFDDAATFWDRVMERTPYRNRMWVFAHNWMFDAAMLSLTDAAKRHGWRIARCNVDRGRFIVKVRAGKRTLELRDTTNYFPMPLASVGDAMGLVKLDMPDFAAPDDLWTAYCARDVAIMRTAMQQYVDLLRDNDLGNFAATTPAQAFAAYRHRFMPTPIYVHDRRRVLGLERDAYYGGRVECFRLGRFEGEFWLLDVNSMYPSLMRDGLFPHRLDGNGKDLPVADVAALPASVHVIARVQVDTPEPSLPMRVNGRLCFPVGRFVTTLADPELRYALAQGVVRRVEFAAWYAAGPLFREYVDALYTLRRRFQAEGNAAFATICKLLLNGLYGKFGERLPRWELSGYAEDVPDGVFEWLGNGGSDGETVAYRRMLGSTFQRTTGGETYASCPSIAATVTSAARVRLWQLVQAAGREHVFYCDTDSVIVDAVGYQRLTPFVDADALGALKVEDHARELEVLGLKHYRLGRRLKLKGIRRDAVSLSANVYVQDQFTSWLAMLNRGVTDGILIRRVTKRLSGEYAKGIVTPSGVVRPFHLDGATPD